LETDDIERWKLNINYWTACERNTETDFGRRAVSYSSPATRNSIPISNKSCSSLYSFKHHLVLLYSPAHKQ